MANSDATYAAYQHGRYSTALRLARPLAAEGDARAQSMLGLLYYRGHGVPQDHNEALRWFRQAADQDDVAAQFYLGVMFSKGRGAPQDNAEALRWFRRAADLGYAQAQYNLGLFYAQTEAGEPDNVSAHMWFNLAAAHFPASDNDDRGAAVRNRDLVAEKMTPDQIARRGVRASGSRNHADLIHLIFRRANVSRITGQWQDENFHTRVRIKASKDVLERAVLAARTHAVLSDYLPMLPRMLRRNVCRRALFHFKVLDPGPTSRA